MRVIEHHRGAGGCNEAIQIIADEPADGSARYIYTATWPGGGCVIPFQTAVTGEPEGNNGLTTEVLLAICIDRLESLRARGSCNKEINDKALLHLNAALRLFGTLKEAEEVKPVSVEIQEAALVVGNRAFPWEDLRAWKGWDALGQHVRSLPRTLTEAELSQISSQVEPRNLSLYGCREFISSVRQLHRA